MTHQQATALLSYFQEILGGGYHPDTPMNEYVHKDADEPIFAEPIAVILQAQHDEMMAVLGDEAYDIALSNMKGFACRSCGQSTDVSCMCDECLNK